MGEWTNGGMGWVNTEMGEWIKGMTMKVRVNDQIWMNEGMGDWINGISE